MGKVEEKETVCYTAEEMKRLAESDYLTGLPNRRGLYDYYNSLLKDHRIHAMFIDIDNFKRVNDIYGHSMGDELLVRIAELIRNNADGFTSRIGGDEYVVLCDAFVSREEIKQRAENMLREMSEIPFRKDILSLISLSIGIVLDQSTDQRLDDILNKCDSAMYEAKYSGKNCYVFYTEHDHTVEISHNIESEMEDALEDHDFKIYLQPKVNMITNEIYGAEALTRWIHPHDGTRMPTIFIPLFEKNGFVAKLDMYNFEEVCRLKSTWKGKEYAHLPISVNMSRLHLYNKFFPDQLTEITDRYGVNPRELELEITENVFIKDKNELIEMVNRLEERGFQMSIDDFGSGYSALNMLKDIPVNTIKIDKEFLKTSSNNNRGKKVIRNVIAMCLDLKLDVVTEGVETKDQVKFLLACGCSIAQGFYYSKPLPVDEFVKFAMEHLINTQENYHFTFDGHLRSEDGGLEGTITGEGLEYQEGIFKGTKSLYFPGGGVTKNVVNIPESCISSDSYTISMWIKPRKNKVWAAALYVKFETGFCSIVPLAWEGYSDYRIRDSKEVDGWYDASGLQIHENVWMHCVITYNAKIEQAVYYMNGEPAKVLNDVPTNRYVKWIVIGGDVFQPSFNGNICELVIYNEAKNFDEVKKLHQSYTSDQRFTGFE